MALGHNPQDSLVPSRDSGSRRTESAFQLPKRDGLLARDKCMSLCAVKSRKDQAFSDAPTFCIIPVDSPINLIDGVHEPGITGQAGEPSRFGAQRVPSRAERVHDGRLVVVEAERQKALSQVQPYPLDWV